MDMKDEFHFQVSGALLAVQVVLAALLKSHPTPDVVLKDIKEILAATPANGQLPAPIQAAFDERMQEFTSHLYVRRGSN